MCFSASASFGISAILLAGGISAVKRVRTQSQIPFAAIPLIFSIQQFFEGILWLSLTNPVFTEFYAISMYAFLIFAQVVWPLWVPFSLYLLESDIKRKKLFTVLMGLGTVISFYLVYCMLNYKASANVKAYHIQYVLDFPRYPISFGNILYFAATVFPFFVSSVRKMTFIGIAVFLSFLVSRFFFEDYVISIWCFFAAIVSIIILLIMISFQRAPGEFKGQMV